VHNSLEVNEYLVKANYQPSDEASNMYYLPNYQPSNAYQLKWVNQLSN